jgi:hypothetical protein
MRCITWYNPEDLLLNSMKNPRCLKKNFVVKENKIHNIENLTADLDSTQLVLVKFYKFQLFSWNRSLSTKKEDKKGVCENNQ